MLFKTIKFVVLCYSSSEKLIHSISPTWQCPPCSLEPHYRRHIREPVGGRQGPQLLRRVRVMLLTSSATVNSSAPCCVHVHGDCTPWAQNTVASSLPVLMHSPPRAPMKMQAFFEPSRSDQLYRDLKQDEK